MTKLSCMIIHFQIDDEKHFVDFHCCTTSLCKAVTVLIFKDNISKSRNAIKMVFSGPFLSW